MNKKRINIFVTIAIILIIGIAAFFIIRGKTTVTTVSEDAAKWIGNHSIVYVQTGCIHCIEQEQLFGDNWKYINSVDCISSPENQQACIVANIPGTPTWVINGKQYVGPQTIAKLETLTGYQQ